MVIVRSTALRSYVERYRTRINRREVAAELNEYIGRQNSAGRALDSPVTVQYDQATSMLLVRQGAKWFVTDIWRNELLKGGCV